MELTWFAVISLAIADSINPCVLSILFLILVFIMLANSEKKSKVLLAGFAFTLSVFVMYFFYGAVIITLFNKAGLFLAKSSTYIYKFFGLLAIILGILNIKDFLIYKPGSFGTEMPLMLRPKVKKIISKVTSVRGAFFTGIFVTLFLLPCTMGPYLVFGSLVSQNLGGIDMFIKIIPYLIVYNIIFVIPMVIITFLVYIGIASVQDAQQWKDKNIRLLHLISGVILFALGVAMLLGWL